MTTKFDIDMTEIFVSNGTSDSIQMIPNQLNFDHFVIDGSYEKEVLIVNKSSGKIRVQYNCDNSGSFSFSFHKLASFSSQFSGRCDKMLFNRATYILV